jgi:hypothetical protein
MDLFRRTLKKREEEAEGGTPPPATSASAPAMTQAEFSKKGKELTPEQEKARAKKLAELLRR